MEKINVLQFGTGGFLRSFCDYFFDRITKDGGKVFNIAVTNNIPGSEAINKLKNNTVYHVVFEGCKNGKTIKEAARIDSIKLALDYFEEYNKIVEIIRDESLEIIISNTTEAGIVFDEEDAFHDIYGTYPAKLARLLFERYKTLGQDSKVTVIATELVDNNATLLKDCVKKYAELWGLDFTFAEWVNGLCFVNTLVDRIVSGYPKKDIEKYYEYIRGEDKLMTVAEPFACWAVEDCGDLKHWLTPVPDGVIITDDITAYKTRKVRILNGGHTTICAKAILEGKKTVKDIMESAELSSYLERAIFDEIIPSIDLNKDMLTDFAYEVLDRFRNPFLEHQLSGIMLNSISKWKARILPTVLSYHEKFNKLPVNTSKSIAYIYLVYKNKTVNLKDTDEVLEFFENNPSFSEFLKNINFWGLDLTDIPNFEEITETVVKEYQ